ncbi:hypothetical protein EUTSA_v10019700mg [Eutrema salsugineum]|uniref:Uncharacterized protein n=1 Tax=Eutrema salsugineum TaxID=72664 RepID=V4KKU6_EUTSA|nr:uncharacterized protein LOC18009349 [Eutrema salsugineum]ESQ27913.1 hypothetical protein EUTSA_v10019700mg [Eutrema salsugineum]
MFRSKSCRAEIRSSSITNKYYCLSNGGKSEAAPSPTNQQPPVMVRSYSTSTYSPHKNSTMVRDNPNSKSKRSNTKGKKGLKGLCEAEIQRKKRVAAYNVYGVEGRVKGSMRKSFKWFKETCSNAVYGLW